MRFHYRSDDGKMQLRAALVGVRSVRLLNITIPSSFYQLVDGAFTFTEDGGGDISATVPAGTYIASTFATELQTQLNAETLAAKTYTVTISEVTAMLTVTVDSGTFTLDFPGEEMRQHTGYLDGTTRTAVVKAGTLVLDCYLASNLGRIINYNTVEESNHSNDVIYRIPLPAERFAVSYNDFSNHCPLECGSSHTPLNYLEFWLLRADGTALDLNGGVFSLTLETN